MHVNSGCSIGGTLLSTQTDTKITVTFVRDYFYTQCTTPGTSANVYISGNGVSDSNAYPLSVPYVKINTNPTLSSAYFDQNGNLTFTGSGFNTNGGYYVDYKFDCTNANGSGCSGKLDKTRITYIDNNKISFGLDLSILNGAAGNVSFRLNDKNDNAISQLYTLPYNVQPTSISAQSGVPGLAIRSWRVLSNCYLASKQCTPTAHFCRGVGKVEK